ncbi:MAG TPA: hypothetical protein VIJ38_14060 [Acidobacteriaceae bacterium]
MLSDDLRYSGEFERRAEYGDIVAGNVSLALAVIRPNRHGELRGARLKLLADESIGKSYTGLKYGRADHAVFDNVGTEFCRNDYVCNLCLSHVANLESK